MQPDQSILYDLYRMKSGHLCIFIIELLYIIFRLLAREGQQKEGVHPGYPPLPCCGGDRTVFFHFLRVFSWKSRIFCFFEQRSC